jgi:hypothetical protein
MIKDRLQNSAAPEEPLCFCTDHLARFSHGISTAAAGPGHACCIAIPRSS